MGLFNNAMQLIRSFFSRREEKLKQVEQASKAAYDTESMLARYGLSGIMSHFLLPQTLLERYNDYDQMVSYPLIATSLKILIASPNEYITLFNFDNNTLSSHDVTSFNILYTLLII